MTFFVLLGANLKLIYRNRQALFWSLAFPILFLFIFGLFFGGDSAQSATIGVIDKADDELSRQFISNLDSLELIEVHPREDESIARQEVRDNDLDLLLIIPAGISESVASQQAATLTLVYDQGSPAAGLYQGVVHRYVDQANLALAGASVLLSLDSQGVLAEQFSYLDFLLPGLVAMGVMTASIFGISSAMATYRAQRILRRLLVAPVRARDFFSAMVVAYLILALAQAVLIFSLGMSVFGVSVHGDPLSIAVLVILGNAIFLAIGFIVGSVATSVEAAAGIGNAVSLPMMFMSGVFFPSDGLPGPIAKAVEFLPLTPMVDGLRGVVLDSHSVLDFPGELALLGVWVAVTSAIALRVLRFT